MKKARMTIEELRALQSNGKLPVTLECDRRSSALYCEKITVTAVGRDKVLAISSSDTEIYFTESELKFYPSLKEEPKTEWLYECIIERNSEWFFNDGSWVKIDNFGNQKRSLSNKLNAMKRKTGRKVKINMETFEFVGEVVNE